MNSVPARDTIAQASREASLHRDQDHRLGTPRLSSLITLLIYPLYTPRSKSSSTQERSPKPVRTSPSHHNYPLGLITHPQTGTIESSDRFHTLTLFSSIYGIGPSTALRLYNLGLRTLADLEVYYGVDPEPEDVAQRSQIIEVEEKPPRRKPAWKRGQNTNSGGDDSDGLGESWVRVALGLREDLAKKYAHGSLSPDSDW